VEILATAALAAAAASLLMLVVLVTRRTMLARQERRRRAIETRLQSAALALAAQGEEPPPLEGMESDGFAVMLARYGRILSGEPRTRIGQWFERTGRVDVELSALRSRRRWRRAQAAMTLGDMGSATAVPGLVEALDDPDRDVRTAAARSLGRLDATEAVEAIASGLADKRLPHVIGGQALLDIGSTAIPALAQLTGSSESALRATAIELIGLTGGAMDARLAIDGLDDDSAAVRIAAAGALRRLGAERAVERLRDLLSDPDPEVRAAAAESLGSAHDTGALEPLAEMARTDLFEPAAAAAMALRSIDPVALAWLAEEPGAGPHLGEAADLARLAR
jgi:HEAT repeat protein